ncbi:MAG: ABC transporter permease [Coriobacteriia bacterium]|nr:ABC transporter permease [Coriobacteriia bacterium]
MKLVELIPKNVLRHKTRTLLTLLGISIGIATILALGAVADGLKESFGGMIASGEADFIVTQAGASDMIVSSVDEERVADLERVDGIGSAHGAAFAVTRYEDNPYFFVLGLTREAAEAGGFSLVEGRQSAAANEALVGKLAAEATGKRPGDSIDLFGESFEIVGQFETGEQMQDSAVVLQTRTLQRLNDTDGNLTMIFIDAEDDADIEELTARIDKDFEGELVTIKNAAEMGRVDQGAEILDAASWMISALAILIGGIGVMNTMIVSVFDRTREIGVLKAVGWRRRTVMTMILGEAVLIGLAAIVVGSGLAMLVLVPLSNVDVVKSFLMPAYSVGLWVRAAVVAILVAVVGGMYPAWHAANLSPVEALRYE